MKIKNIPLIALLLISISLSAQDDKKHFQLKLYSGLQLDQTTLTNYSPASLSTYTVDNKYFYLSKFSPAFAFLGKTGNYQEIELTNLSWSDTQRKASLQNNSSTTIIQEGNNLYSFSMGMKYKYAFALFKSKNWKIKPLIAPGILMNWTYNLYLPTNAIAFSTHDNTISSFLQIEPGFDWNVYKNAFVHFSLPISLCKAQMQNSVIDNPSTQNQSAESYSLTIFPNNFQVKLGIGYRI